MTRINLIDPALLTDQHLLAEYRELPRIFTKVRERLESSKSFSDIPSRFLLGTGHMKFFYNKLLFLENRQNRIIEECIKRKIKIAHTDVDLSGIPCFLMLDFEPTESDLSISKNRLKEKLMLKPNWYKFKGGNVDEKFYD